MAEMLKIIKIGPYGKAETCEAHIHDQVMWISEITCTLHLPSDEFEPSQPRRFPLLPGHTSLIYDFKEKKEKKWTIKYHIKTRDAGAPEDGQPNDIIVDSSGPAM